MRDYSRFPAPREVSVGRRFEFQERRPPPNRNLLYGLLGVAVLCICIGLFMVVFTLPLFNGHPLVEIGGASTTASNPPSTRATATPARTSAATPRPGSQPTAIPLGRGVRADNGLKLTVTIFQRPLPVQGVTIPDGQELALVSVRFENTQTTGSALQVRPQDLTLVSGPDEFKPNVGGITTGTMLAATALDPGKIVEGDVVYYIYSDVGEVTLSWKTSDGVTRLFALPRSR